MLENELLKSTNKIKDPFARVLIFGMFIVIGVLAGVIIWQQKKYDKKMEWFEQKIDDMQNETIDRLRKKTDESDSLNKFANKIISK